MTPFFAGVIFGSLFAGSVFTLFITRARRPEREITDWTEKAYEPPVATKITVNKRTFSL